MRGRSVFGDETWRLAREGDAEGLRRAAGMLLGDPGDLNYEGHRARAFALAVEGKGAEALADLNEGWTEEWPFPAAYALDVARVRYLARDYDGALDALQLSARGAERLDDAVAEIASECVRRAPRLWWRGVRVTFSGGTTAQSLRAALVVVRARFGR